MQPVLSVQDGAASLLATFTLRGVLCGLDASAIQEVIRVAPLTPVPQAASDIAGILNLRGRLVTVIDLGLRLGFARFETSPSSRVLIVDGGNEFVGLLVDSAGDVLEFEPRLLDPAPANVPTAQARFIRGVCRTARHVVTLIDASQACGPA